MGKTSKMMGAAALALSTAFAAGGAMTLGAVAVAQDYTSGAIQGLVVDTSGNPISGASVTIISDARGTSRSTSTSSSGQFRATSLPTGSYTVQIEAPGFTSLSETVSVRASAQAGYNFTMASVDAGDTITVTGVAQNLAFSSTTTGINLNVDDLVKEIPLQRDLTSVTLLAPSTVQGDASFGNLSAIGGSSVAENAYYVNGLNITDFNNYLGSALVPFDFYESVEVKTGGYSAEYGRATGGVVNAVTKSGTNELIAELHLNWEPDELRADGEDTYSQANIVDERSNFDAILEVGGPILQDKLFFYGIVELNDNYASNSGYLSGATIKDTLNDPFWGLKLDGYLTDDHHFEYTYFNTRRTTQRKVYPFDANTLETDGTQSAESELETGGESWVAKYTGTLTDWFTISSAYGVTKNRDENHPISGESAFSYAVNLTDDPRVPAPNGGLLNSQTTTVSDNQQITEREFFRVDADLFFNLAGDHHVRAGFEQEDLFLGHFATRTGVDEFAYIYRECGSSPRCQGTPALTAADTYVELNYYNTGGAFDAQNKAYYIQDEWSVTDRLLLSLGVRLDQFANFTANGSQYVDFDDLIAPRLGFSYDVMGDGRGKLFGSYGVYYLPVASNTSFRQGSSEFYFREYWTFDSVNGDGSPNLNTQLVDWPGGNNCPFGLAPGSAGTGSLSCNVTGDGSVQDPTASVARNIEATEENEFIIGYEHQFLNDWKLGLTYMYRDLVQTAEDSAIDAAVLAYCDAEGIAGCDSIWTGYHQYTIGNPGEDWTVVLSDAINGETDLRTVMLSAADLGYPKAERTYTAVEFNFERPFDGTWSLRGSYVWSESEGNSEGYVQSDFGQDDAGITQDFDQPGFTDGAYGRLPNDRTHQFKAWGTYAVTDDILLGANALVSSPRPLSCFGYYPVNNYNNFENGYGAASHYCDGVISPRGEAQETDWTTTLNLSGRYNVELPSGSMMTLRADIFNVFNEQAIQSRQEVGENDPGVPNPRYGLATGYNTPRYVRIGLDIGF